MTSINRLITFKIFLLASFVQFAQLQGQQTQSSDWQQYVNVEDAGYASDSLDKALKLYESSGAAALFVVYKGKILIAGGDNTRRFMVHSIRKSFLSALYGIYAQERKINLNKSLNALNIDDIKSLTASEKTATIKDLLSARSGVYLPSAYSTEGMKDNLPARGSHKPGTYWYYNNWDFNTLCTIFEQETKMGIFDSFKDKIADPIGMQDFRPGDGHYRYEKDVSRHPAYLFNMSARDMARFGLLYLNNGKWQGDQIISEDWIDQSCSCVSRDLGNFSNRGCYGYLWWVSESFYGHPMYYASGSGGHRIMIFPDDDLVIVHRVNTYEGRNVSHQKIVELVRTILNANTGESSKNPELMIYTPVDKSPNSFITLDDQLLNTYLGSYKHPFLGFFTIIRGDSGAQLSTNIGTFNLYATDQNHFYPQDLETMIEMIPATDNEKKMTIEPVFGPGRKLEKAIFYY